MRSVDKQSDANSSRTNKLNATVMLVSWCTFWRSPSSSPWIQHDTTWYNQRAKTLNKHQQTVRICQVPLSGTMPLYATQSHSKPSGQDLVHCLSKAVLCLPSRSTEHFTQNHQWQSTILRYPSFKGRTIRDNPRLNQLNQLNYIGWIKIMMTSCKDTAE